MCGKEFITKFSNSLSCSEHCSRQLARERHKRWEAKTSNITITLDKDSEEYKFLYELSNKCFVKPPYFISKSDIVRKILKNYIKQRKQRREKEEEQESNGIHAQ
jgi:hypothetical protein